MRNIWFPIVLMLITLLMAGRTRAQSFPNFAKTDFVTLRDGTKIELRDGVDLSGQDLSHIEIHREYGELHHINFSGSIFSDKISLDETVFVDCSFRGASLENVGYGLSGAIFRKCSFQNTNLRGVWFDSCAAIEQCDFTDAYINDMSSWAYLTMEQLRSTRSWKIGDLRNIGFGRTRLAEMKEGYPLTGMDLRGSSLVVRSGCDLTNADIRKCNLFGGYTVQEKPDQNKLVLHHTGTFEMIQKTRGGKKRDFTDVTFTDWDFSGTNFSGWNLTNVRFKNCILQGIDFTDAVISGANCSGLTLEQIKQTWNYKYGHMESVTVSDEVKAALNAEKEKPAAETNETPEESKAESGDSKATEVVESSELEKEKPLAESAKTAD
ncbi:MAG: pentapeptide repeat-containing protein [Thermoguttaceae bacterium]|nr:pentapeptide repeat-containing protein [Thermoguttaceae bacterium]